MFIVASLSDDFRKVGPRYVLICQCLLVSQRKRGTYMDLIYFCYSGYLHRYLNIRLEIMGYNPNELSLVTKLQASVKATSVTGCRGLLYDYAPTKEEFLCL